MPVDVYYVEDTRGGPPASADYPDRAQVEALCERHNARHPGRYRVATRRSDESVIDHSACIQVPIFGGRINTHGHEGVKGAWLFPATPHYQALKDSDDIERLSAEADRGCPPASMFNEVNKLFAVATHLCATQIPRHDVLLPAPVLCKIVHEYRRMLLDVLDAAAPAVSLARMVAGMTADGERAPGGEAAYKMPGDDAIAWLGTLIESARHITGQKP